MSTNTLTGNASLVKLDSFGGGVYVATTQQNGATLTTTRDMPEGTNKDSGQTKEYVYGNFGWNATFDGRIDTTAAGDTDGMILAIEAQIAGNKLDFQFLESGTADTYTGTVLVAEVSRDYPQNDIQTYTINLQGTGALTKA